MNAHNIHLKYVVGDKKNNVTVLINNFTLKDVNLLLDHCRLFRT
jgi:hypothetical protein